MLCFPRCSCPNTGISEYAVSFRKRDFEDVIKLLITKLEHDSGLPT